MWLGNDHTSGFAAGACTPSAQFADNDLALGQLISAMSKSRFWKEMAIFVLEDDAQDGSYHVDSTMFHIASMLRTIELILGLKPMTHFDAAAVPMWRAFHKQPDLRPYELEAARVSLTERNPSNTKLAQRTAKLDFSEADLIEDAEMNEIL